MSLRVALQGIEREAAVWYRQVRIYRNIYTSQEIHNTRTLKTILTYESTLGLPTKPVY